MTLRDKAIDAAYDKFEPTGGRGKYNWEAFKAGYEAAESVMPKWTYCKDAMPEEYDWYSVTIEEQNDLGTFRYTDIISFGNKAEIGNCWFLDREGQQVVAWQARPEPAK